MNAEKGDHSAEKVTMSAKKVAMSAEVAMSRVRDIEIRVVQLKH